MSGYNNDGKQPGRGKAAQFLAAAQKQKEIDAQKVEAERNKREILAANQGGGRLISGNKITINLGADGAKSTVSASTVRREPGGISTPFGMVRLKKVLPNSEYTPTAFEYAAMQLIAEQPPIAEAEEKAMRFKVKKSDSRIASDLNKVVFVDKNYIYICTDSQRSICSVPSIRNRLNEAIQVCEKIYNDAGYNDIATINQGVADLLTQIIGQAEFAYNVALGYDIPERKNLDQLFADLIKKHTVALPGLITRRKAEISEPSAPAAPTRSAVPPVPPPSRAPTKPSAPVGKPPLILSAAATAAPVTPTKTGFGVGVPPDAVADPLLHADVYRITQELANSGVKTDVITSIISELRDEIKSVKSSGTTRYTDQQVKDNSKKICLDLVDVYGFEKKISADVVSTIKTIFHSASRPSRG